MNDCLKMLGVYMGNPFTGIYINTKKTSNGRGGSDLRGFTMNPIFLQTSTILLILHWQLPVLVGPAVK